MIVKADEDEELLFPDLDPLDDEDFVVILGRLAQELSQQTERQDAKALRDSLDMLDVAWALLSVAAANRIVEAVRAVLEGSVDKVIPRTSPIFEAAARAIIPATKQQVIEQEKLEIDRRLTDADRKTGQALLRQQGLFIRDEYGRRADNAVSRVRAIVGLGVEQGLSQEEITSELANDLTLSQLGRARAYWDVLGTSFATRARTTIQLNAYEQAGVKTYRFVAVMDNRTSRICQFLNNRVFKVAPALARLRKAERMDDADAIRDTLPWVYTAVDTENRAGLYYSRGNSEYRVAYIDENGFSGGLSDEQLQAAGVAVPPIHVRCRSKIVREG